MGESYWIDSSEGRIYGPLAGSEDCKCGVIGGGIAGLTTAYLLTKEGKTVVLVDANKIGEGCTGRNTGKVTTQHDIIYSKIKNKYDLEKARSYYDGNKEAIDFIEKIVTENNIECEFERGTSYIFAETDEGLRQLKEEYEVCKEIDIDCNYIEELPIPVESKGAIAFNNVASFNPKMYCDRLGDLIVKQGGKIFENSPVTQVESGEKCSFQTREGKWVQCEQLVLASHFPFYDGAGFFFSRLDPKRTYLVAGEAPEGFAEGMYINVEEPGRSIHYINKENEHLLLIAGDSHKVGVDKGINHYEVLKEYGRDKFGIKNYRYEWSAEDYMTPDNIPYIGPLNSENQNIYVATGFGKWGMTNGTLAGIIISDLIVTGESKYEDTFNPSRAKAFLSSDFFKFNMEVVYNYIKGKLKVGDMEIHLEEGEGKIINLNGKRYGAYKEGKHAVYIVDITCTHLGCELNWNENDKSWDCPCHGSRFNYKGEVLEGPATEALKPYKCGENKINSKIK